MAIRAYERVYLAETCKRELKVLEEEWKITKGEPVDSLKKLMEKYS